MHKNTSVLSTMKEKEDGKTPKNNMGTANLDWGGGQRELLWGSNVRVETSRTGRGEQSEGWGQNGPALGPVVGKNLGYGADVHSPQRPRWFW